MLKKYVLLNSKKEELYSGYYSENKKLELEKQIENFIYFFNLFKPVDYSGPEITEDDYLVLDGVEYSCRVKN